MFNVHIHRASIEKLSKKKDELKRRIHDETPSPTSEKKRHFKFYEVPESLNICLKQSNPPPVQPSSLAPTNVFK